MQNQTSFQVYNASAGSGKTFTLVKEYIKILLQSDDKYLFQNILAITFTNKAAAEMKERVITNLREISMANKNEMLQILVDETGEDKEVLQNRAKNILDAILQNYTAFNINTIDTFTHKLIRTFALDLGLSVNFDVEMDTEPWLNEAVENVISQIGIDKNISKILIDYALQQADDDRSWDVSNDLNKVSKILLNENDAVELEKLQKRNITDFLNFKKYLIKQKKEIENDFIETGKKALTIIDRASLDYKDFYRSMLPNHFINLSVNLQKVKFFDQSKLKERIEENTFYANSKPEKIKLLINGILPELLGLYDHSEDLYKSYSLNKLLLNGLTPLAVLSELNKSLNEIKEENNIKFIAEFNQIISKHLIEQPVAFIYERIGERFKHFFIDEMQDTSVLQWHNLIPLIANALAQEDSGLLLVGDAKQSIYRWRGGKPEQFICLASDENKLDDSCKEYDANPFHIPKKINDLDINYRSFSEIINFNNNFFTHSSKHFIKESHTDLYKTGNKQKKHNKKGGYVNIDFIEGKLNEDQRAEIIPEKVAKIIYDLDNKIDRNDICILVRKNKHGETIANYLSQQGIPIISSETLLLRNDKKVDFIINLLYYLTENKDKNSKFDILYFLHSHIKIKGIKHVFISDLINKDLNVFFKELEKYQIYYDASSFAYMPLYESIEYIIRSFRLTEKSDAYLQFFLDEVFKFSQQKSQSTNEFLAYWELKKDNLNIASSENKNAVKISTIHKSKGLEYRVVIFPYDLKIYDVNKSSKAWYDLNNFDNNYGFDSFYINSTATIKNTGLQGENIFQEQLEQIELDNFNILYVAFTRAVEQLYIISENDAKGDLNTSAHFLKSFLKETGNWQQEKYLYEFGINSFTKDDKGDKESEVITIDQEEFISTPWQDHKITIVANSTLLWDSDREKAIQYGNIIHEIMAKVIIEDDVDKIIDRFTGNGNLNKEESFLIKDILHRLVTHPKLNKYYQKGNIIFNEREIVNDDKQIFIPDRLIFHKNNKVTIIDYKTGNQESKHIHQIESYATILNKMDYSISKKLLVYIDQDINIVEI